MPIKFRCPHCQQFLGISRSRAGAVTDCPTCGRSIRVPLLDGTVPPLPSLEMNLDDGGLATALEKLASLAHTGEAGSEAADRPAAVMESAERVPVQAIPLPEPITLGPAPAPAVIQPTPNTSGTAPAAASTRLPEGEGERLVDSLAEAGASEATARSRSTSRNNDTLRRWQAGVLALAASVVAFAAGFGLGRRSTEATADPVGAAPVPSAREAVAPAAALPAPAAEAALTGRISYVAAGGETHPDVGARVLVLPEERMGATKLPIEGLRPGAHAADLRVAMAAVQALGGDFAVADESGQYSLRLPQAGLYQVLMMSRYQPRDDNHAQAAALQFLGAYFDRPAQLLGDTAVVIGPFRYRGSGTSPRDQTFELP